MKGQTEIIGIMILVIIITIAMLFYISFSVSNAEESTGDTIRKEFVDNELSVSFVKSLNEVHVEACDAALDDLIRDCGLFSDNGRIRCSGASSCDHIHYVLGNVSNASLDVWGKSYDLRVDFGEFSSHEPYSVNTGDCDLGVIGRRAPGVIFVPYYPSPGQARLELAICKT